MKKILTSAALLFAAALAFISCGDKDSTAPGYGVNIPDLVLDFDKSVIQASGNDVVTFRAFFKGEDVSASSSLFLVEGKNYTPMTSMSFYASKVGNYTFQVAYGTSKSDFVKIAAISREIPKAPADSKPQSTDFVHRTFLNQHTGAECPNCPFMTFLLKKTLTDDVKDKVVLASVRNYGGETGFASVPNPASSWPYLHIDYAENCVYNAGTAALKSIIDRRTSTPAAVGISATPEYHEDGQILVTVAVKAAVSGEYNVGLWLLQDGYYRKQTVDNGRLGLLEGTWGDSYNFHNNSVRVAESKYLGSHIGYPLGRIEAGQTKEWRFVVNVNLGSAEYGFIDHWWEGYGDGKVHLEDLHFAAFVTTPSTDSKGTKRYTVVNAIDFPYNTPAPFDYQ